MRYNILFVPRFEDRTKISPLRARLCRRTGSNKALQYPVHMSLVSGGFSTADIHGLIAVLQEYCKSQKAFYLYPKQRTDVLPKLRWSGIHLKNSKRLHSLRTELQKIRNSCAKDKQKHFYHPLHITCTFEADVSGLQSEDVPVHKLLFDRITITRRKSKESKYRIFKHIEFGTGRVN